MTQIQRFGSALRQPFRAPALCGTTIAAAALALLCAALPARAQRLSGQAVEAEALRLLPGAVVTVLLSGGGR